MKHRRALTLIPLFVLGVTIAPEVRADEAPPRKVLEAKDEPPPPPTHVEAAPPAKVEPAKVEPAKAEPAKAEPAKAEPAKAADPKKTEAGGMCRVGTPAGGWELLALLGLGLRRRRAQDIACR